MKSKQFLVLGLGRFGASLAKTLCDLGQEVLAVDADEELVNNIAPYVTQAMQLDATDETLLATLGVKNFDAAIVSIGQNTRDSILVCVLLKELGAPYLVAKANDDLHAKVLRNGLGHPLHLGAGLLPGNVGRVGVGDITALRRKVCVQNVGVCRGVGCIVKIDHAEASL